ncbi:hypothetical protein AX15_002656 [Amanita polypyramis BW_CC]|nr:hypothetical protein AX15_002656 [Amanita polypyramis BW_CC]
MGSLAIASKGQWTTGVSTDIGTSFVRPGGKLGDVLHARATLTAMGRQLAFTRVDFMDSNGNLVAYGHHTKYIGRGSSHAVSVRAMDVAYGMTQVCAAQNNVKLSEDGERIIEGEDIDVD